MHPSLPPHIESQRLLLRPLTMQDLPFFTDLHQNPAVVSYLGGDGSPRPPEVTQAWMKTILGWYRDGVGPYGVVRRRDGELIGRCGLSFFEVALEPGTETGSYRCSWGQGSMQEGVPFRTIVEVGYVIHPEHWGRGYATEAAAQWYRFGFQERGEDAIYSIIHADNTASIRVAEKNALTRGDQLLHLDGRDYYPYIMTRQSWLDRTESKA